MKVISYQGPDKIGKTSTLKELIKMLQSGGGSIRAKNRTFQCGMNGLMDVWCVFEVNIKGKNTYVGVITAGDAPTALKVRYDVMIHMCDESEIKLDWLFIARHDTPGCKKWVDGITNCEIVKTVDDLPVNPNASHADQNRARAKMLLALI